MAERTNAQSLIGILIAIVIAAAVSIAGSQGGDRVGSLPVFAICGVLAFAINWLAFIPAALTRSEHYYDLVGGLTYISVTVVAVLSPGERNQNVYVVLSGELDLRATLVAAMVLVWSIRLASFLFLRISKSGGDSRFDDIKHRPLRFLLAWSLQGLWVLLTAAAALAVITGGTREALGPTGILGIGIWLFGFLVEVVADRQKSAFKSDPANKGRFINVGLWAWSRHPNYFGEIVLWTGMAVVAVPVLQGWQWVTLISPVFVALLLLKVSGIPLLEEKADERWGGQDDYEAYKQNTPVLIPKPPALQTD